ELDARHAVADLAGDELLPAPRRLVIEENARTGEEGVALAVVDRDVVAVDFRDAVRAARVERCRFALRDLAHLTEHFARRRLVETDAPVDQANGLEHARNADGIELRREYRLLP